MNIKNGPEQNILPPGYVKKPAKRRFETDDESGAPSAPFQPWPETMPADSAVTRTFDPQLPAESAKAFIRDVGSPHSATRESADLWSPEEKARTQHERSALHPAVTRYLQTKEGDDGDRDRRKLVSALQSVALGAGVEATAAMIEHRLTDHFLSNECTINMHPGTIAETMATEGLYHSQRHTGTTMAVDMSAEARMQGEERVFGRQIFGQIPATAAPKYMYLNTGKALRGAGSEYGPIVLSFDLRQVASRATVTPGDSLLSTGDQDGPLPVSTALHPLQAVLRSQAGFYATVGPFVREMLVPALVAKHCPGIDATTVKAIVETDADAMLPATVRLTPDQQAVIGGIRAFAKEVTHHLARVCTGGFEGKWISQYESPEVQVWDDLPLRPPFLREVRVESTDERELEAARRMSEIAGVPLVRVSGHSVIEDTKANAA